ncbi:EamA family transporter [Pandoraea fibrosis]|uniref:EamA family transporter n=1 Tax=Pandoraea fibrosis TaxID=1891094 RepID=A0ABX6HPI3_9BURK|nr:DMT family transporter [Pandoraea fibrosis]QHE93623.1 EamA family transporter [Pandoraea fibrosis]QHF12815.1 EamA family transporter [Pandoraea fibrosis]
MSLKSSLDPVRTGVAHDPLWLRAAPLIFLFLWSVGFTVAKIGLAYADPLTFLALRYGLVLVLLAPLAVIMRPPLPKTAAAWGHLVVIGLLIQALYFSMTYLALRLGVSAGSVALITSLQPILVALAVPHLVGERVSGLNWMGLGLGLAGAALVIVARSAVEATSTLGLLLTFVALGAITCGTLYEKRFGVGQHPVTSNLVQYAVGFAVTLPLAGWLEPMHVAWTWQLGLSLVYLVIGNSIVAISLLLAMIRRGEASRVSALFFLVPPSAALAAWIMVGEHMPPLAWGGMVLAAIGVAMATRRKGSKGRS